MGKRVQCRRLRLALTVAAAAAATGVLGTPLPSLARPFLATAAVGLWMWAVLTCAQREARRRNGGQR